MEKHILFLLKYISITRFTRAPCISLHVLKAFPDVGYRLLATSVRQLHGNT